MNLNTAFNAPYFILFSNVFCMLVHDYTLCFTGSPCCDVSYYNYSSMSPYYIVIHFRARLLSRLLRLCTKAMWIDIVERMGETSGCRIELSVKRTFVNVYLLGDSGIVLWRSFHILLFIKKKWFFVFIVAFWFLKLANKIFLHSVWRNILYIIQNSFQLLRIFISYLLPFL